MLQQSSQNTDNREISTSGTVIDTLCEKFNSLGIENDYLSTFLDKDARNELLSTLSKLPVSKALIMKITSGDATAKEVLTVIKNLSAPVRMLPFSRVCILIETASVKLCQTVRILWKMCRNPV